MRTSRRHLLILTILFALAAPLSYTSAQTLTSDERAQLEAQLVQVQAEQAQAQKDLAAAKGKSSSLANDIALIAAKIKTEQLDIQAKQLKIKTLSGNIDTEQKQIVSLSGQIDQNTRSLADMFRQIQRLNDTPLFILMTQDSSISELFDDAITLASLQQAVQDRSKQLGAQKASSAAHKQVLEVQKNSTSDALFALQQVQKQLQADQAKQKQLLSISKSNEKSYAALIAQKKKQADAINARLFALAGGSNAIPFGTAYKYALSAQQATGIDPAYLLAVMTQESNLGSNQGTCYLADTTSGAGASIKSGRSFTKVMNPTRDIPPFLQITSALNVDPLHTVVSCPQSVGWGGAMGPAQFIPSTWLLFSSRIGKALGFDGMANPWNPRDAFMASALYLTDLGAASGGYTAQSNAACRYYSGSACGKSSLVASYATSVMKLAATIQTTEIDKLQGI